MTNEELVLSYQNGNKEALDELISKNEGLIHYFANKFKGLCPKASIEYDDLLQEGWIAFINAVSNYKPTEISELLESEEKQASFGAYAGKAIRHRMFRVINVAIPRKIKTEFETEIIVNSIDALLPGSEDAKIIDFIPDEKANESYDDIIKNEYLKELRKDLLCLLDSVFGGEFIYNPHTNEFTGVDNVMSLFEKVSNSISTKEVLLLHYGLFGESMTFAEIGKKLGISASRIGQIEASGIYSIRKSMRKNPFGQYFADKYEYENIQRFQRLQEKKDCMNLLQSPEKVFFQINEIDTLLNQFAL